MMIFRTGNKRNGEQVQVRTGAFTLIELILVMTLLVVVFGVSYPSLKGFFHGRNLDSEARRFLSLTHYGQSRAISEGIPTMLWIDSKGRSYGLRAQPSYSETDSKAVEYVLDKEIEVETQMPFRAQITPWRPKIAGIGNVPMIRFLPDGSIGETSPDRVVFRQSSGEPIWIVENTNRLSYAIQTLQPSNARP